MVHPLLRAVALVIALVVLPGCDSAEPELALNTFEVTITGDRTATLNGPARAGPVTHVDETTYELQLLDIPAGQIILLKRSLVPLQVRTYVIGGADAESFGGGVSLSTSPLDFGLFSAASGRVVVERVDGRDVEGRLSMVARSFEGEEVLVEGVFRIRTTS